MAIFTRRNRDGDTENGGGAPATVRPGSIGDILRETREQYGATIEQIGVTLRIRPVFLEAIEQNRYDRLPGMAYALGFVRSYADHLGLDGEALARRFKSEVGGIEPKRDLYFPVPLSENSLPRGTLLAIALVLAGIAYLVWYFEGSGNHARPERVSEVPPQIIPLPPPIPPTPADGNVSAGPPADTTGTTPGNAADHPASAPTEAPSSAPINPAAPVSGTAPVTNTPPTGPPETSNASVPATPGAPQEPRVFGAVNAPSRITLTAKSDSWIQVRAPDQSVVSMRVLKAGDSYRVPDRADLTLSTGNAGGLAITVDGHPVPPVGPVGKRRTVALDPDKLSAGSAAQ